MDFLLTPLPDQNKKAITFVIGNIPFRVETEYWRRRNVTMELVKHDIRRRDSNPELAQARVQKECLAG